MFVGAICHDLDHRGFNNKFMIDVGSPLAAIYSTSTMEHHHFNMTVTILQQVDHFFLKVIVHVQYCLDNAIHCILVYPTFICLLEYFNFGSNEHKGKSQHFCQTES